MTTNKKKHKKMIFIVLIIIVFIIGSVKLNSIKKIKAYEEFKISKADELATEYSLSDAVVKFEYIGQYKDEYRQYDLIVESSDFEKLKKADKYNFIESLGEDKFNDSYKKFNLMTIVLEEVISNGNKYNISHDDVLRKNNEDYYGASTRNTENNEVEHSTTTYEKEPSEDDKGYSWAVAIKEVENNLKAPSTAKFPRTYLDADITEVGINTFVVKSYVDAENSFGAKIRNNFMVKIKRTGENTYNLLDIQIFE